jgi:hexosaminidase
MQSMKWSGKKYLIILSSILLFSCSTSTEKIALNTDLIPFPKILKDYKKHFVSDKISISFDDEFFDKAYFLKKALSKYSNIEIQLGQSKKNISNVNIQLIKSKELDSLKDAYQLIISEKSISIIAKKNTGIFYGIQTLIQLTKLNNNKDASTLMYPCLSINDWPEFAHRGMLLDCCRHFFEVKTIKKYIDLLAFYKMNVLHWHLTEDQGWRIAIDSYPKLNSIGSWRKDSSETYGGFYTKKEIKEIVSYAQEQHVEIIPEIELPGHSQAAVAAYPNLSCTGDQVNVANDWGVFKEIYCAGNDSVFLFLEKVLDEVIELFPSKYIHIGGDEAPKKRWQDCQKCQQRIKTENLKDEHELQRYFIERVANKLRIKNKTIIGWDEILEGGTIEGAVVQSWRGFDGGISAIKKGNKAIMSPTSHCYFDYDIKTTDLYKVYNFNPIPENLTEKERKLIIGGECNLWSERILNEKDLDQKTFPRILAMSEVLWTYPPIRDSSSIEKRVNSHNNILGNMGVNYGISVEPVSLKIINKSNLLKVKIIPGEPSLTFKYGWDTDSIMKDVNQNLTLQINRSGIMSIQGFKNQKPYGKIHKQEFSKHNANGGSVEYISNYSEFYESNYNYTLTDGKIGSLNFKDGNWQGFFGKDIECIIDLNKQIAISTVKSNFFQYSNSWIFLPEFLEIQLSIDGQIWSKSITENPIKNPKERGGVKECISVDCHNEMARYIKIKAKNRGPVPDWHEAAGSKSWLFIDEVIVE